MPEKKIVTVLGATGAQGGGLVRAIQGDPDSPFHARAVTRDAHSEKARGLAALGAEVVSADVDDEESLKRAFDGATAAYCITFYWAPHFSPERELAEAQNMARAAKAAGIAHVIWSTLEDTRKWVPLSDNRMPTLMGKYKVPHFDGKGEADSHFTASAPTTLLLTSFYWDNFIHFGMGPQKGPNGGLAITFPMGDKKLPGIAAEAIGKRAYRILQRGGDFIGKRVGIAGEHLTGTEMAAALSRALGREIGYNAVPPDVY